MIRPLGLIAAYVATGMIGLHLAATGGGYAAPIWLPTGVAGAAMVAWGCRYAPAIWLGGFLVNFGVNHSWTLDNVLNCAGIATGNMLEALAICYLMNHLFRFSRQFERLFDVMALISSALLGSLVSATIGVSCLALFTSGLASRRAALEAGVTWWVGDALGGLLVMPMLLSLGAWRKQESRPTLGRPGMAYFGILALMSLLAFAGGLPKAAPPMFLAFVLYSLVILSALWLTIQELFFTLGALAAVLTTVCYLGHGPLGQTFGLVPRLVLLQFSMGCAAISAMIVSAIVSERIAALELAHDREVALAAAEKMAVLGEMASRLAHEVNNPLAVIFGKAALAKELVLSGDPMPTAVIGHLERIESMAGRIERHIRSVGFFSRQSDNDPFVASPLRQIVAETVELCSSQFQTAGVELIVEPVDDNLVLECKAVEIGQVLLNLLNNARSAAAGGERPWVRLSTTAAGDVLVLSVLDSGPGVPAEVRARIFEPFFTTKKAGEGTGLGLSVARKIVEQHQGRIELDEAHRHTRFVVTLPRTQLTR